MQHFQGLSSEIRLLIGRLLLDCNHDHYHANYPASEVDLLAHPNSPFRDEARNLFPRLTMDHNGIHSDCITVRRDRDDAVRFLQDIEGSLFSLSYGWSTPEGRSFFEKLKPYCTDIKKLSISAEKDKELRWQGFIEQASQSLEDLSIENFTWEARQFKLDRQLPNLKSLVLHPNEEMDEPESIETMEVLLKALGNSVECAYVPEYAFNLLHVYCPNLKDFVHDFDLVPSHRYIDLLKHYGNQVCDSSITGRGVSRELLEKCPNLKLSYNEFILPEDVECLQQLTPHLTRVDFFVSCDDCHAEEVTNLRSYMQGCTSVSELDIDLAHSDELDLLEYSRPSQLLLYDAIIGNCTFPQLQHLRLVFPGSSSGLILSKILPIVEKLSSLTIVCRTDFEEHDLLQLCAAGVNLQQIQVTTHRNTQDETSAPPHDAVSAFKKITAVIKSHVKLRAFLMNIDSRYAVSDEVLAAAQCVRLRRIVLQFGIRTFLYGKCLFEDMRRYCSTCQFEWICALKHFLTDKDFICPTRVG